MLVAGLAVLSRLQPGLFPANETGAFLDIARSRLNWPLNYWNGLAAFCALGVPLALALAAGHRHVAVRALERGGASGPRPLHQPDHLARWHRRRRRSASRSFSFAAPNRPRIAASLGVGGLASAILVGAAAQRDLVHEDLRERDGAAAGRRAHVGACWSSSLGAGLVQAGIALLEPIRLPFAVRAAR